jgi:hypothetical protein
MIVPKFWAEAVLKSRTRKRQITVRKLGWSDDGPDEAQAMAELRAADALARIERGEPLTRRERKAAYNVGEGVPIREEIVQRLGETVITRNVYGARCLNTPNVLFADLDFDPWPSQRLIALAAVLILAAGFAAWYAGNVALFVLIVVVGIFSSLITVFLYRFVLRTRGGIEGIARRRVEAFLASHPDWNVRLYRTPAGIRLLATHRTFDPREPEVAECFAALKVDPLYALLCHNQNCFRARVSPKPWRIGRPSPRKSEIGVWPVKPERMVERQRWISEYEAAAHEFAACRFLAELGSGHSVPATRDVQRLHDEMCGALGMRPPA